MVVSVNCKLWVFTALRKELSELMEPCPGQQGD